MSEDWEDGEGEVDPDPGAAIPPTAYRNNLEILGNRIAIISSEKIIAVVFLCLSAP